VPAAAVIPAPIVSMVNAAVKRSVVFTRVVCLVMVMCMISYGCTTSGIQRMRGIG